MKKPVVITDLTRMHGGRVCIAGYDSGRSCVRPVLPPPGILESMLYLSGRPVVFPSAEIEIDLGPSASHPPHTEDVPFMPRSVRFKSRLSEARWRELLSATLSDGVSAIFEQPILAGHGCYVIDGRGPRSLGTVRPARVTNVVYRMRKESKWEYRLGFVDSTDAHFELPVTDLAWRYYVDHLHTKGLLPCAITAELTELLQQRTVFLRIGLARGWVAHPGECYLQITGVHTFPDYLLGLTFADYAPDGNRNLLA